MLKQNIKDTKRLAIKELTSLIKVVLGVVVKYNPENNSVLVIPETLANGRNTEIPLGHGTYILCHEAPHEIASTHGIPLPGDIVEVIYYGIDPSRGWVRFIRKLSKKELDGTNAFDIKETFGSFI